MADGAYGVRALCHRHANLRLLRGRMLRSLRALHEASNAPGSRRTAGGVRGLGRAAASQDVRLQDIGVGGSVPPR